MQQSRKNLNAGKVIHNKKIPVGVQPPPPRGRELSRLEHPVLAFLKAVRADKSHPLHKIFKKKNLKKTWEGVKSGKTRGLDLDRAGRDLSNRLTMRNFMYTRTEYSNGWANQIVTTGAGYSKVFELDQLPGYTDFTTLFDQYRFVRIDFKLIPRNNVQSFTQSISAATSVFPNISVWFDPDDATNPLAVGESLEVENALHVNGFHDIEGHFKPQAAIAAYGGAFTQFAAFDGWCDCTSDDTQWYSLKAWVSPGGAAQTEFQYWDAYFTSHVEFRKVR